MIRTLLIVLAVVALTHGGDDSPSESKAAEVKKIEVECGGKVELKWPKVDHAKKYKIHCKGEKTSLEESSSDNKEELKFEHAETVICTITALDKKGKEIEDGEYKIKVIVKEKDPEPSKSGCEILPWVTQCEKDYNRHLAPGILLGKPTVVKVLVYISDIQPLGDEYFWFDIFVDELWTDPRLKHNSDKFLNFNYKEATEAVWQPDIFFPYSDDIIMPDALTPNQFLRIEKDGSVRMSYRVQFKLRCKKNKCILRMESYGHYIEVLEGKWDESGKTGPPIDKNPALSILKSTKHTTCDALYFKAKYACWEAELVLKKQT